VDTVIEAIGQKPEDGSTEWYPSIKVDRNGLIQAEDETGETSVRGIFAGGDIVRGPSLIVNAIRDGKRSASAITNFLLQEVPVC
jgi:NADPH-dependent glutamate synthase beta subunit-like oxidoreductase